MGTTKVKSFDDFKKQLQSDTDLQEKFKVDPRSAVNDIEKRSHPLTSDKWIYRIIVLGLIVIVLCIVVGLLILYGEFQEEGQGTFLVPDIFVATASAAIGAVAGLLTPSPKENTDE
ncbi:MAG: hypothetical protein ABFS16_09990 [Bacteroidota bacterium]